MTHSYRITFIALLFVALEIALIAFVDRPLSEYLRTVDAQHPDLIRFFRSYTDLGKSKWYLWPSGIGVILCALLVRLKPLRPSLREGARRLGGALLFLFLCVGASGIITDIIKPVLGRTRPVMLKREGIYDFHPFSFDAAWNSLPSGHATTAFALAFILAVFFPRGRIAWIALAFALAISRVLVNAHFLSDVLAGGVVGYLTVMAAERLINHNGMFHIKYRIFPIDAKNRLY